MYSGERRMAEREPLSEEQSFEQYRRDVSADHYLHWAALLACAGYAWQLHGIAIGITALIGTVLVIAATNLVLMSMTGNLKITRINRWLWVILLLVVLLASGAQFGSTR
jgi:hypothetical protein